MSKQKARISKEKDFFLVIRHEGVYCEQCSTLILDGDKARQIGIARRNEMISIGWEIQPAGWLLLVVPGILLILAAMQWLRDRPTNNPQDI
jgi:hypothetical protein